MMARTATRRHILPDATQSEGLSQPASSATRRAGKSAMTGGSLGKIPPFGKHLFPQRPARRARVILRVLWHNRASSTVARWTKVLTSDTSNGGRATTTMKKSGSKEGKGTDPSQLIDARIKGLSDWRGETLARVRMLIKQADPEVVEEWKWRG